MTKKHMNNILEKLIQLNPFDAVAVLQQFDDRFIVERVNEKALALFNTFEQGMEAEAYFKTSNWQLLKPNIMQDAHDIYMITLDDNSEFAVSIQSFIEDNVHYVCLVLRVMSAGENAYRDELTDLYNRRALYERWKKINSLKDEKSIALILVDLDRFKKFNESLGKTKADSLLREVSRRFKKLSSECCDVFRYSGDEFVFIMYYVDRVEVDEFTKNIFNCLKKAFIVDEQDYFMNASIGIATVGNEHRNLDKLLNEADQALFYVKNNGRTTYRYYDKQLSHYFPNEALMEAHLHRAIELDELTVHFQPQIDLNTNRINSFEALIRWNNRKFGMVSPGQFIPLAESSGLILSIGDWVLERVCQYQKEWRLQGFRPVRIAVNISPKQFKQKNFVTRVEQLLKKYEVDPQYLELEITESSMTNLHETTSILIRLKKLGVYVSVDDFGTGYSSLSYLKTYPIDIIKIDQSFIADIQKDKKNEAIVAAIILLSHTLGMEVIAEGVEEEVQEQFLRKFNCQKVQGYLYDRPLPANQIVEQYFMN
ncbi:bifunctional diguanylate cyclase/phosphodiesterase [Solibacillus sp. CAU 1738]|uniref:putative bifunctional diguanylate cyclase/phosphodiesterase n=1 Tax=Solibacillus sp. CAU 1738 TaxID=3140363 RepID=UPI0032607AC7